MFDWTPFDEQVSSLAAAYATEQKTLTDLQQDGKRNLLAARVLDLRTSQWLSQNKTSISEEIVRLAALKRIEMMK